MKILRILVRISLLLYVHFGNFKHDVHIFKFKIYL